MYTRCPQCRTIYRINVAQLRSGRGEAICNRCNIIFGALENLGESLEEALADHTTCLLELPQLDAASAVTIAPLRPPTPVPTETETEADEMASTPPTEPVEHFEPSLADLPDLGTTRRYWRVGAVGLTLLLVAQLFFFEKDRMAQEPHLRPLLMWFCSRLGCELPPFRNLAAIEVVDRALYPIQNAGNGYEFHLVIVNHAPYPQPYPLLKLTLMSLDGTPVAQRIFKPDEYLRPVHRGLMPTHQLIFIDLTLAPPGRPVGGFQFEFL